MARESGTTNLCDFRLLFDRLAPGGALPGRFSVMAPSNSDRTPASLLARLSRAPQPQDWSRFVELYTPLMFKWARSWEPNQSSAADLVQGAFAKVVEKMPTYVYDPSRTFRGWLWTVLHNLFLAEKRRKRPVLVEDKVQENWVSPPYPNDDSDLKELIVRKFNSIRGKFEPQTIHIFEQCVFKGRSQKEVAAELDVTPGLVARAIFRVREQLRHELREELGGLLGKSTPGAPAA